MCAERKKNCVAAIERRRAAHARDDAAAMLKEPKATNHGEERANLF